MSILLKDIMDIDLVHKLQAYARYHETMTEKTCTLGGKFFTKEARFTDPVRELYGRDDIADMFTARRRACETYRFKIIDSLWGEGGQTAYWRWDRITTDARGIKDIVSGMSEITFDMKGSILAQIDYFDAFKVARQRNPFVWWLLRKFR